MSADFGGKKLRLRTQLDYCVDISNFYIHKYILYVSISLSPDDTGDETGFGNDFADVGRCQFEF